MFPEALKIKRFVVGAKAGKNYYVDVLVLQGDKDSLVNVDYIKEAVKAFPNAELIIYEGEEHGFTKSVRKDADTRIIEFVNNHIN